MVLAGLLVRLLCIEAFHIYRFRPEGWSIFEMAIIGRYLATGHGYILQLNCGPSAWTAPLYPVVAALAFRVFGVYSHPAAFALLTFNGIFSALTSYTIYRIASRVCNETIAVWSGWIWAFLPSSVYFSVFWIWETELSAFLLSAAILLTLQLAENNRIGSWCAYGLLWGLAALTNPSVLLWLPFAGAWIVVQVHRRGSPFVFRVAVGSLVFWALLAPWLIRNYLAFDNPFLIRTGFGVNLRAGNNPYAQGWWVPDYTYNNPALLTQYKRFGESMFVSYEGSVARRWIAEHPRRFITLTLRRIVFFWFGIPHQGEGKNVLFALLSLLSMGGLAWAIARRIPGLFLFVTLVVVYPMTYYITFPQARYRQVIEPETPDPRGYVCLFGSRLHSR